MCVFTDTHVLYLHVSYIIVWYKYMYAYIDVHIHISQMYTFTYHIYAVYSHVLCTCKRVCIYVYIQPPGRHTRSKSKVHNLTEAKPADGCCFYGV